MGYSLNGANQGTASAGSLSYFSTIHQRTLPLFQIGSTVIIDLADHSLNLSRVKRSNGCGDKLVDDDNDIEKIKREEQKKTRKTKTKYAYPVSRKSRSKPVVGARAGDAIGNVAGDSLGISGKVAGAMIAVNGGWTLASIGAVIGYLGFKAFNKKNKENKK